MPSKRERSVNLGCPQHKKRRSSNLLAASISYRSPILGRPKDARWLDESISGCPCPGLLVNAPEASGNWRVWVWNPKRIRSCSQEPILVNGKVQIDWLCGGRVCSGMNGVSTIRAHSDCVAGTELVQRTKAGCGWRIGLAAG